MSDLGFGSTINNPYSHETTSLARGKRGECGSRWAVLSYFVVFASLQAWNMLRVPWEPKAGRLEMLRFPWGAKAGRLEYATFNIGR